MNEQIVITGIFLCFAFIEAIKGQLLNKSTEVRDDLKVELISTVTLFAISQPVILWSVDALLSSVALELKGAYEATPVIIQILCFLIFDDMAQYWWHRASHTFRPLYNLHRAHHNGKYMSVRIVYRNNIFYYLMMPSIWFSGVLVYLGFGWVYAAYLIVKLAVIIGAHAEWKWDSILYKRQWLNPVTWLIERTISTPSTHSAHHGLDPNDGVTNYKGNYGNLLFFWDVLFGTAKITRKYPTRYGVSGMFRADWKEQLIWPLYKTPRKPKNSR
ncbi:sterol desaturase family protein [Thalassotalea sp. M1531]|uniref:Sterol desaturase family protein n=1 Tax=Thalassotalea algicola TaxID=2716224 RepID=A0A7Y0LGI5_9GAMM|nr:sterol desaturase family protein [Thalassotalea algicola]NMP33226.1 sterol desaturase family protein [Thalassotalea algicola]